MRGSRRKKYISELDSVHIKHYKLVCGKNCFPVFVTERCFRVRSVLAAEPYDFNGLWAYY